MRVTRVFLLLLLVASSRCMCSSGYTGQNCESDYIPCNPSPCENGASCHQLSEHEYECICPDGKYCAFLSLISRYKIAAMDPADPAET
ncbi:Neurogenic locus notch protein-like protein [Ooceraea biroi]|uniref:Neurogenic locus notch protein-like protein n=1 Tax=Ooceraea biroi TaxID=2015173 RepID=A0A026WUU9_OOCBI|nr:Neurogenic locus notch protein-like protein [Ooceraea biroi]